MKIYLVALGQFSNPSAVRSISSFAETSTNYFLWRHNLDLASVLKPVIYAGYWLYTAAQFLYDDHIGHNIYMYKIGGMGNDDFLEFLHSKFGDEIKDEDLITAWNDCIEPNKRSMTDLNTLAKHANAHENDRYVIFSATNPYHDECIKEYLNNSGVSSAENIKFSLSYYEENCTCDHRVLVKNAISDIDSHSKDVHVFSLCDTIKNLSQISEDGTQWTFEYAPFNPNLVTLQNVFDQIDHSAGNLNFYELPFGYPR